MLTKVAIVGRPNVGKSTLFNRFIGRKKAIIHDTPGTTRDRNDYEVNWKDKKFIVTDTAGWSGDESVFSKDMERQLNLAVEQADIILFVVDGKIGIHPFDAEIAKQIRQSKKTAILVVNKIDTQAEETKGYEFYSLGFDEVVFISANHGRSINELLDKVWSNIKYDRTTKQAQEVLKIILVGKPNVGKSSFVNSVSKEERSIVHDAPGTTRDSLTVNVNFNNKDYILIDSAGLHRGSKMKDDMEYLSTLSTDYAIEDADVAVLVADASQGIGETEVKIARLLHEKRKPVIVAVNKWDLIEDKEQAAKYFTEQFRERVKFMDWADVVFISAKTGQRLERIFQEAEIVYRQYNRQLTQEELNALVRDAVARKPLVRKGKVLKFKEYAQVAVKPPVFIFSVNDLELLHFSYERFLENFFRERFGFHGTPIVLKFRQFFRISGKSNIN
ncbi:ribosome biogenesis GTPase Der [Endomicrobium proavitum]|uniref:GTPase Der n=1 Tax=Endomicrobium proavitum TaxID=1408281 RepID=A0A0G3WJ51_9BACT|nr:ribosome biogenesis GTPase Der [Endomicrobium proavitum]AKL97920.1 GTP-binding protein EngA [Endomicrobium proavitum]